MAVYENRKALPGTERKPRPKKAVERVRLGRALWRKIRLEKIAEGKNPKF